ncbi:MAG: hypothetical protein ABI705_00230 [Aestuariivirga sp.]
MAAAIDFAQFSDLHELGAVAVYGPQHLNHLVKLIAVREGRLKLCHLVTENNRIKIKIAPDGFALMRGSVPLPLAVLHQDHGQTNLEPTYAARNRLLRLT